MIRGMIFEINIIKIKKNLKVIKNYYMKSVQIIFILKTIYSSMHKSNYVHIKYLINFRN